MFCLFSVFYFTPFRIDWTNGKAENATAIAQIEIQAQAIPTAINGIATLTGIIVGFSVAILGIVIRDFLKDSRGAKEILIGSFGTPFILPMIFLFLAYYNLAIGQNLLTVAWGYAFDGFITSLFQLLFVFLFIAYVMENPPNEKGKTDETTITNPPPATQPTEEKPKSEKKQPQAVTTKQWVFIFSISAIITSIFSGLTIPFGIFLLLSVDALKALIEGIATILGFFGLVAIYLLTSFDSRIDKLEEKILDLDEKDEAKINRFRGIQDNIKTRKKNSMISILTSLGCLFVSLFLSIWILSILSISPTNPGVAAVIGIFIASMLLFIGVFSIFVLFFKIGKEPE